MVHQTQKPTARYKKSGVDKRKPCSLGGVCIQQRPQNCHWPKHTGASVPHLVVHLGSQLAPLAGALCPLYLEMLCEIFLVSLSWLSILGLASLISPCLRPAYIDVIWNSKSLPLLFAKYGIILLHGT